MKRARFTEEQIIGVLNEQEAGAKTADLARKHGVSEATLYNWKAKYGGMDVSEAKRLKQLEDENAKLKKLLAEQMLDVAALRELLGKNGRARRQARRCRASAGRYGPVGTAGLLNRRRGSQDDPLPFMPFAGHKASNAAARSRRRATAVGYRRLFILLRRDGEPSGINRVYRLYREEGLTVRKRRARRRAVGSRAPILVEEIAKPLTLALRLFGNLLSSALMLSLLAFLVAWKLGAIPVGGILFLVFDPVWKLFDLVIGAIQAFIFALLTILYFDTAMSDVH